VAGTHASPLGWIDQLAESVDLGLASRKLLEVGFTPELGRIRIAFEALGGPDVEPQPLASVVPW